jgi:GntR family transcriptional regulator
MNAKWNNDQPIYRQLRDRTVSMILESAIAEGEAVPSARTVAAQYRINHLTVLKAYQELADEGLIENRRGVGLFVCVGARARLLASERKRFLAEEWPRVRAVMRRLGLTPEDLARADDGPARAKAPSRQKK